MTNTVIVIAIVLGLVAAVMVVVAAVLGFRDQTATRLTIIERRLTAIMAHLGVPEPEPDTADIIARLSNGDTVGAIKLYRRRTGASLLDAKNAVEEMARSQDG
jgi:ribosomal protein L7/L12